MAAKDSFEDIFKDKERVLVIMSHPDDAEAFAAGTIARLTKSGIKVRVVKMTSGGRGSKAKSYADGELMNLRESEDAQSMKVLGIKPEDSIYFRIVDGEVENDLTTIGKISQQIRIFKPDLVITQNPDDIIAERKDGLSRVNHRDHRNTARSVIDAIYPYARDNSSFPEHIAEGLTGHTVTEVLLADAHNHPQEVFIDITDVIEIRKEALSCHASQFNEETLKRVAYQMPLNEDGKYYERFRYAKIR